MGHTDTRMVSRTYAHLLDSDLDDAIKRCEAKQ